MARHGMAGLLAVFVGVGAFGVWAQTSGDAAAPAVAGQNSVRIVRLSQVRGLVKMDRNTGRGFETAIANAPVVGKARLATGDGIAEVEFEDNSSLRLTPRSAVGFTELSRTAAGGTVTEVTLLRGTVYVSLEKTKGNAFALQDGDAKILLTPGTHLRLDAERPEVQLAVFEGQAALTLGGSGTVVGKHQTVEVNPAMHTVSMVEHGTEEQDFDAWDKQEKEYHQLKAIYGGVSGFGLYGANDLSYYGSFSNLSGCGNVWRPYFADASWDPFGSGMWALYPGAGYSWVSPYPWGWLPYHSGSWVSCGAAGWGWQPGGAWYGLSNAVVMREAKRLEPGHPLPHPVPPTGPGRNGETLVPVNMKQLPVSGVTNAERFAFRQNSAGLGVPRGDYGNLRGTAMHVERNGFATRGMEMSSTVHETVSAPMGAGAGRGMEAGRATSFSGGPARSSFTGSSGGFRGGASGGPASAGGFHGGGASAGSSAGMSHGGESVSSSSGGASGGMSSAAAGSGGGHH